MDLTLDERRSLENLWNIFQTAANRKRKSLPIHLDEFQKYADVLKKVITDDAL